MTTPESLEALLRPLAERGEERFAALRCTHPLNSWYEDGMGHDVCALCCDDPRSKTPCLRTGLGSLVRCAAACGFSVAMTEKHGEWLAVLSSRWEYWTPGQDDCPTGRGASPEEALARALVAAVGAEEAK